MVVKESKVVGVSVHLKLSSVIYLYILKLVGLLTLFYAHNHIFYEIHNCEVTANLLVLQITTFNRCSGNCHLGYTNFSVCQLYSNKI